MSPELVALVMFIALIVLIIMGVPMGFAMGGIAVVVILVLWGPGALLTIPLNVFGMMWNVVLIAVPLFIYMGFILERAGIIDSLYEAIHRWSGPVRGGMAMGTTIICAVFAAMTGITGTATVSMGLIALPQMLKRGYDKSLALGTIAGPGTLGILIPPSIVMIFMALVARTSVGKLFMGGIFPGLLLAGMFIVYIGIKGLLQPQSCPAHREKFTLREKIISTRAVILPILLILAVLGSIFFGIATPTEAAAIGAAGALLCLIIQRRFTWRGFKEATYHSFRITSMVFWITWGAAVFSATFTALGIGGFVTGMMAGLSPTVVVIVFMLIVFILGMFLDPFPIILIVGPIAFPIVRALGLDITWFGILFVLGLMMGYITPPFGFNLFYLKAVVPPGITLGDIYRSIFPFLGVMIILMAVLIMFPQIVLWLPDMMIGVRR